jgi:hypothetical protein
MSIQNLKQVPERRVRIVTPAGNAFYATVRRNDRRNREMKIERAPGCFEVMPYDAIDRVNVPLNGALLDYSND